MRRVKGEVVFGGRIAYCAQSAWILNTTVRENIIFGSRSVSRQAARMQFQYLRQDLIVSYSLQTP
jgi:ABC-type iron transport system FetAB ATPase subunit